jgi:hypothetical protein
MKKLILFSLIICLSLVFVVAESTPQVIDTKWNLNPFGNKQIIIEPIKSADIDSNDFMYSEGSYDYPITQISKTFLWIETDKVAEYKITDNTDQCLTNCFTKGKAVLYQTGKLFDDFNFFDGKGDEKSVDYKSYILTTENTEVVIPDYKEECLGEGNKTICENVKIGEHKETQTQEVWKEYNGEDLEAGNYIWKIEGIKNINDNVDMIPSAQGVDLDSYIWWSSSWQDCKNITIGTSLTQNEAIMVANLTTITFSNITEIRIVNAGCGLGGAEIKSTVLSNDSNWAYVTWLANLTGSNAVYSVYYNNPTNPVKTLEASPDFCEFNDICGWTNVSAQGFITPEGTWNSTANSAFGTWNGIYSPIDIGTKKLILNLQVPTTGADEYIQIGFVDADSFTAANPSRAIYGDWTVSVLNNLYVGGPVPRDELDIGGASLSANYLFYFDTQSDGNFNISIFNSATAYLSSATATQNRTEANMSLGIGTAGSSWTTQPVSIDYMRAYDLEAVYVNSTDMPTFTLGSEEILVTFEVIQNFPDDYYNSSESNPYFACNASDITSNLLTLELEVFNDTVEWYYSIENTSAGQQSLEMNYSFALGVTGGDGVYTWNCSASNDNGEIVHSATRTVNIDTTNPSVSIVYPINSSEFIAEVPLDVEFNVSATDANPDTCKYYNFSFPDFSYYPCVGSCGDFEILPNYGDNVTLGLNYNWTYFIYSCNDTFGHSTSSSVFIHIIAGYPVFSTYWDDNATLIGEGVGSFNVTIANTNGTVLLEINGENMTATNESAGVYNASYNFTQNGVYDYLWHSWSADGTYNQSELQSYTVNVSSSALIAPIDYSNLSNTSAYIIFECNVSSSTPLLNLTLDIESYPYPYVVENSTDNDTFLYINRAIFFGDGQSNWTCIAESVDSSSTTDQFHFTMDSTPPSISTTANGTELFCQDEFPCNVTFRIDVSDSNPDTCMYYNCTPIYLADLETCEGSYEPLTVYGDNVTIAWDYGWEQFNYTCNDTFGNVATQSILTFLNNLNSTTFNTPVTAGSNQLFVAEVYYDPDYFVELNVQFEYNNSNYTGDYNQIDVNDRQYYKNLVVPSIQGNYSFDWFVQLINGSDASFWLFGMNSNATDFFSYEQEVIGTNIDNCSANDNNIMNLTLVDETAQTALNTNIINVDIILTDYAGVNQIANFSQQYNDTNPVSICIDANLSSDQISFTSEIEYTSDDHAKEYYNLVNSTLNGSSFYNITLFDLLSTENTDFKLTFSDDYYIPYPDVQVYVNRQYVSEGTYKTVELPLTDSKGQAILHLIRNNQLYNLVFVKNGVVLANFEKIMPFCADYSIGDCEINLNMNQVVGDTFNSDGDLGMSYTPITYDNSTKIVSFSFTSLDGSNKCVYLNVTRNDLLGNRSICSQSIQTSSGNLFCMVPEGVDDTSLITTASLDSGCSGNPIPFSVSSFNLNFSGYGANGYLLAFVFVFAMILLFGKSKEGALIGILLGFITSISLGFIYGVWTGGVSSGIWLVVIILIMLWKMNRGHPN